MKPSRILLFIAAIITALAAVGFAVPNEGIDVGGLHLQFASLHSIVAKQQATDKAPADTLEAPATPRPTDSIGHYRYLVDSSSTRLWLPNTHYMDRFWHAAEQAHRQGRTLRVLHYGDSQIELDHISSRLRANLQQRFGGSGPGMLPAQTITPTMTVRHGAQGDLTHLASFGDSLAVRSRGNYGLMMQCFRLAGQATVSVRPANSSRVDEQAKRFDHITLIANTTSRLEATLTDLAHKKNRTTQTATERGVVAMEWNADSLYTAGIRLSLAGQADIYALLVDGDSGGIAVDNIPMRGCSGQQFTLVNERLLSAAYSKMDVGLIIMQFGGNSVPYLKNSKQVSTYCQSIGRQIDYLHRCAPSATILFVGPSDMSTRVRGQLQTYPIIPELIDSLAATATAHDAAYWSIYHAMGGHNSMQQWTRQGLAGSDYIHFSQKGADAMGELLTQGLMNSYRLYQLRKEAHLKRQQATAQAQKAMPEKRRHRRR